MELLAPAGSFDALRAAVQSGADAVYIGGSEFSARRSADNFTTDEIKEAADYCHIRGVKLHVAANILIKEKETGAFLRYVEKLNDAGVDAVIIQDIGMASVIRQAFPDLPLHASTQMTVTSLDAAKRLEEMGFSRIVLARELSREAIEKIAAGTGTEIEVFAHGAICMCYSGQCLMSSMIGGRSGNRGMCAQPCRLQYQIGEKKGYLLSPKDLSLIDYLDDLKKIGVDSLKIEGRLKRSEYVAAVTGIYRKYIDSGNSVTARDRKELTNAFNRSGLTSAYFGNSTGAKMMSYENPANVSNNIFSDEVKKRCAKDANFRKTEIFMSAELKENAPLVLQVWDSDGHFAESCGTKNAETANCKPLSKERLCDQLLKLGNTPFFCNDIAAYLDDGITVPVSEINSVRRTAIEKLKKEKCRIEIRRKNEPMMPKYRVSYGEIILTAQVETEEQAKICIDGGIRRIYADTPLANRLVRKYKNAEIVAKLSPIFRDDRKYEIPKTDSVLASNIGQLSCGKSKLYGDFRLNIFNSASAAFYNNIEQITFSPELNLKELEKIARGCEVIGYGRIPLMVMENCPLKAVGKCQNHKLMHSITDRHKEKFLFKCCEGCVCELLNSKPIFVADRIDELKKIEIGALRLIFTVENSEECGKIINIYTSALSGRTVGKLPDNTFTRGHFFRGAE
ncbi:MAG: U32 family peptidase [Firmicutes bacterium]|nr:U32 family peptidase [Bacillota bacterium]